MSTEPFTLPAAGLVTCDPGVLTRCLVRCFLVVESKVNRDQVIEFFYLVGMADEQKSLGGVRYEIDELVIDVAKDPKNEEVVGKAVRRMQEHLDSLGETSDPRKQSSGIAKVWKKSKLLREGTEVRRKGEMVISETSSDPQSNTPAPPDYNLRVDVRQEKNLKQVIYAIRCVVPGRAQHGQVENLVRYAASAGMVYQVSDDGLRQFNGRLVLSRRAVLYSRKSPLEWNYLEGSTRIDKVEDPESLQLINTKSEHFAIAVVCPVTPVAIENPPLEPDLFALPNPRKIEKYLRDRHYRILQKGLERSVYKADLSPLIRSLTEKRFAVIQPLPPTEIPNPVATSPPLGSPGTVPWGQPHPATQPNGTWLFSPGRPGSSQLRRSNTVYSTTSSIDSWHTAAEEDPEDPGQPWPDPEPVSSIGRGVQDNEVEQAPASDPHSQPKRPEPEPGDNSEAALVVEWSLVEDIATPTVTNNPAPYSSSVQTTPLTPDDPHDRTTPDDWALEPEHPEPKPGDNSGAAPVVDLSIGEDNVSPTLTSDSAPNSSSAQASPITPDDSHDKTTSDGWAVIQTSGSVPATLPCRPSFSSRSSTPMSTVDQGVLARPEFSRAIPSSPSNASLPSQDSTTASGKKKKGGLIRRVGRFLGLTS
ncbi:hypothetical protein M407DRAFT_11962 [Tulasnella calospora MUT 4182]|uniref:Uncharacterized protein n=1 Tax=Tulasnella calospora MUT 4182 TaxID=1051891 RepID=A0A0C3KA36_9AGAM|nr:hypothetical protein M407DRAFT_11962 [Tulasnella calospora MUT 4182]